MDALLIYGILVFVGLLMALTVLALIAVGVTVLRRGPLGRSVGSRPRDELRDEAR